MTGLIVGSVVYGAGRDYVSQKLAPLTAKLPAGDLADEVGMGALSYLVAKGKVPFVNKVPYSREIGRAGLTIEAARVGQYLAGKFSGTQTGTSGLSW